MSVIFICFGSLRSCCAQDVSRSSAHVGLATPLPTFTPHSSDGATSLWLRSRGLFYVWLNFCCAEEVWVCLIPSVASGFDKKN
jgi:hypothetical protein